MAHEPHDPLQEIQRAGSLLMGLFRAVGTGYHTLTLETSANASRLGIAIPFIIEGKEFDADRDAVLEALVILRLMASQGGSATVRTCLDEKTSRVRGWKLKGFHATPLSPGEIAGACLTDPETGEPSPEPDVEYAGAPSVHA
ncbi:hypothetical protein ACFQ8C_31155 [Streptomyces sp. NPDC056503]|uniref:hypothetical protein n=1 Tax=Streptomyces sp. NPDC056503 TaxID=3345842 RepID=UPI003694CFDC